ncbi:S8 family serine peptidase [Pedobacter alpinus]|uniref:S8 family serine peptidase n=1 Tax=Pedobacter alpinus TaxID=1590643 RepID=A0ABW5TPP9_9SPHI
MLSLQSFVLLDDVKTAGLYKLPNGVTSKDYQKNKLIIKFKKNPIEADYKQINQQLLSSNKAIIITSAMSVFKQTSTLTDQQSIDIVGLNRIYEVDFESDLHIENVISEILKNSNIEYAEPSFVYHTFADPNDTGFAIGRQNYLQQVKALEAWNIQPNANEVVIAIVDSGSDLQHEDLANNIHYNLNDPINGIDDDGDGYIDNYMGWDFVGATAEKIIEDNNPDIPADSLDHGVHVSGLASAVTNNNIGIASIAQNAKLMILKTGADNSSSSIYKGYEGIVYAANHGAKIINCSWGGPGGGAYGQDVINYAVSKGCLVVVAAGNKGTDELFYPAAYSGAFAVANLQSNDVKSVSSSYGYHVAIAAPGSGIYSTLNNNQYGYKSGTSMATPIVASAAALVLAKNPALTGFQVGEILRLSTDDIYSNIPENANFNNKIGSGRLNVFKALQATQSPAIRYQKISIEDASNGALAAGDTLNYYFDLKNVLMTTNNIEVTLTTNNPNVKIISGVKNTGNFSTLETKILGPFKIFVNPNTPENTTILFKLGYSNTSVNYNASEFFTSNVNLDYQNITVNQLYTTITSNGRVGYSSANAHNGLGVLYKDFSTLYEGSLMIGVSNTQVSNNVRSNNGGTDNDFKKIKGVARIQNTLAAYEGVAQFNDTLSTKPIGLSVINKQIAFKTKPDDKYVIVEYEVINNNKTALNNVYVGLFTDWDVDESSRNILKYDENNKLSYVYATTPLTPYVGVKLLSNNANPLFYPMSYQVATDLLYDGSFTVAEKYQTLTSGIKATSLGGETGLDVMCVVGNGPYNILPNKSIKIAFAIIAGDNLDDITQSALAAQTKYIEQKIVLESGFSISQNYPNPAKKQTNVNINLPEDGLTTLEIFDNLGKRVKTVFEDDLKKGIYTYSMDLSNMKTGIYFYRCTLNDKEQIKKMIVVE